jgi:hypothetical protein
VLFARGGIAGLLHALGRKLQGKASP